MKNILTALLLSISILSFGQTTMNIYQSNGTTVNLPVSTIDSVNFTTTPPPSRMNIYQMGGGIISIVIANIDSITYTVQGTSSGGIISNPGAGVIFNGYTYNSIVLGNGQEWMSENLRTTNYANGESIYNVTDGSQWENRTTGAWAHYNNNIQYEYPFGKLYNWYTVVDPRNVCPTGWHVPTDTEWTVLIDYLGGDSIASGKMKSVGTQYWQNPNYGATNESGFTAEPGGSRSFNDGIFEFYGAFGSFWSSTEDSTSSRGVGYSLDYNDTSVYRGTRPKPSGSSIRCIRD